MPVRKVGSKFAVGRGKAQFKTRAKAEAAQRSIKARNSERKSRGRK